MAEVARTPDRISNLACVAARLRFDGRHYWLLKRHERWGDWSFVGGHVEADEFSDWLATARREAEEELAPLRWGVHFDVRPLPAPESVWGPEPSRSSGGIPTRYHARWYFLEFLIDPIECFCSLPRGEFILVDEDRLASQRDRDVTNLVDRLRDALPKGLGAVPYAWDQKELPPAWPIERRDASGHDRIFPRSALPSR